MVTGHSVNGLSDSSGFTIMFTNDIRVDILVDYQVVLGK